MAHAAGMKRKEKHSLRYNDAMLQLQTVDVFLSLVHVQTD